MSNIIHNLKKYNKEMHSSYIWVVELSIHQALASHEWMNEWMSEWVNEWTNEQMNECHEIAFLKDQG